MKQVAKPRAKRSGGSGNPIVFHDYESFIAKFSDNPKTTDDCYTPKDIYEAVVEYVGTITDMTDKVVLRPFYPGGDYENADYPDNGVVIDNPPFSLFAKIVRFYTMHDIPFFLFGPGLTIGNCTRYCTAVIVGQNITFENGASVRINFASNLYGDTLITTAPTLTKLIEKCASQKQRVNLPSYEYPLEVLSVSDMQTIASGDVEFSVKRSEAVLCRSLDNHPSSGLFGDHWLVAKAKAKAKATIHVKLSKREQRIVNGLDAQEQEQ